MRGFGPPADRGKKSEIRYLRTRAEIVARALQETAGAQRLERIRTCARTTGTRPVPIRHAQQIDSQTLKLWACPRRQVAVQPALGVGKRRASNYPKNVDQRHFPARRSSVSSAAAGRGARLRDFAAD
jgi:hypothetical protein